MKKLIFLFAIAFFASCETAIENLTIAVSLPIVSIQTPAVPSGTYTISKEISIDSLNTEIKNKSGKTC